MFSGIIALLPLAFYSTTPSTSSTSVADLTVASDSSQWITSNISTLAQVIGEAGIPGQSVGVVRLKNGSVDVEFGTWGQYTEDGDRVVPETRFAIGSCSKAFTAAAVGILMDDFLNGRNVTALPNGLDTFNWETKVHDLFPGDAVWGLQDQWSTEKANVADMLSHVTGLTGHDFMYMSNDTPATIAPRFRHLRQNFELRQQYSYNSIMYIFAAHIVETYSGKSFADFVKERIFEPLGMASTTLDVEEALGSGNMSQGWASTNGRRIPLWLTEEMPTKLVGGGGGIMSNTVDMTKWAAMLLNGGVSPYTNKTIVPGWIFDATTTARTLVAGNVTGSPQIPSRSIIGYALGWARYSYQGHDILTHDGGVPGFLTTVMVLPEDDLAIVSFVNTDGPDGVSELLSYAIVENTLGLNVTMQAEAAALAGSTDSSSAESTPSSSSTSNCTAPKVPTAQFAGTYTSGGYGNITLCALNNTGPVAGISADCNGTLTDFASLGPLDANTLYARSPRIASHFSMERSCDSDSAGTVDFVMRPLSIYPHGYGKNTTAFAEEGGSQILPGWHVKCVVDGDGQESAKGVTVVGCGWMDVEDGQWTKPSHGSVQGLADVWWDMA